MTITKQDDGTFLNEQQQLVNETGILLDDDGKMINEEGFLINELGQLLDEEGHAVDAEGFKIDEKGARITAAADEGDEEGDKGKMIPKHRYDSAARRAKLAEDALQQTRGELAKLNKSGNTEGGAPKTIGDFEGKISELDAKIEAARKDGDIEAVIAYSKEMRVYERGMFQQIAKDEASSAGTKAEQKIALDALITKMESDYDAFNPDSESYDQDVVDEVLDLQAAFIAKGDSLAQAMAKAVGYVMGEPDAGSDKKQTRKTDVNKNLDAASKMAPKMGAAGKGSDAGGDKGLPKDVADMSTEEFDALPADTKKRLRGDTYVAR